MVEKIKSDITKIQADIIVNAANTHLRRGGGVAAAIAREAGHELEEESIRIGYVPIDEFAVTSAGNLKAKKVIHIPTIDYTGQGKIISYEGLTRVFRKVLQYCKKNDLHSIATPLLGTGVVGLEKQKVEEILAQIAQEFPDLTIKIINL